MSHTCTPFTVPSIFAPKFPHKTASFPFKISKNTTKSSIIRCSNVNNSQNQNQQVNLSVLRFTLGIPGFDESYLPRWIGYAFGSLLVLNHLVSSTSTTVTPPQLRTEVLGLSLAAFSVVLPYIGQFLKGANPVVQASIPEGAEQIFAMSPDISNTIREDLAWGSYTLLRNTNSISVLISVHDVLCVRGYWNTPKSMDLSKDRAVEWFKEQMQQAGLVNLTDTLYFPQRSGNGIGGPNSRAHGEDRILHAESSTGSVQELVLIHGEDPKGGNLAYMVEVEELMWILNREYTCKTINPIRLSTKEDGGPFYIHHSA